MLEKKKKFYMTMGYNPEEKVSVEEFKKTIIDEQLDKFVNIQIQPENISENMIALIEKNNNYFVINTGERASFNEESFEDIDAALNYMLFIIRIKKRNVVRTLEGQKKTL